MLGIFSFGFPDSGFFRFTNGGVSFFLKCLSAFLLPGFLAQIFFLLSFFGFFSSFPSLSIFYNFFSLNICKLFLPTSFFSSSFFPCFPLLSFFNSGIIFYLLSLFFLMLWFPVHLKYQHGTSVKNQQIFKSLSSSLNVFLKWLNTLSTVSTAPDVQVFIVASSVSCFGGKQSQIIFWDVDFLNYRNYFLFLCFCSNYLTWDYLITKILGLLFLFNSCLILFFFKFNYF